jgi:hypothetical protein
MRYLVPFLMLLVVTQPAQIVQAQSRYGSWNDPDAVKTNPPDIKSKADISKMVDELDALVDEATKARAANPVFLQDLRALAKKYADIYRTAWPRRVLSEDFQDGNFSYDPVWTVKSGEYRIEKGWGLRSVAVAATAQQNTRQQSTQSNDPAAALLEALLQSALGGKTQSRQQPTNTAPKPTASVIYTAANIGNTFDLTTTISSWRSAGQFSLGPYQGSQQQAGYRLAYKPGQPLALLRVTRRGATIIDTSARPINLEDKKVHTLRWTRDAQGRMQILLDNQAIIDAADRSFRDPFSGLVIRNTGSDVIVKTIQVNN